MSSPTLTVDFTPDVSLSISGDPAAFDGQLEDVSEVLQVYSGALKQVEFTLEGDYVLLRVHFHHSSASYLESLGDYEYSLATLVETMLFRRVFGDDILLLP